MVSLLQREQAFDPAPSNYAGYLMLLGDGIGGDVRVFCRSIVVEFLTANFEVAGGRDELLSLMPGRSPSGEQPRRFQSKLEVCKRAERCKCDVVSSLERKWFSSCFAVESARLLALSCSMLDPSCRRATEFPLLTYRHVVYSPPAFEICSCCSH